MYGAKAGKAAVVEALIKAGADANNRDRNGNTALKLALKGSGDDIARLLRRAGATE
jgi:ankyrin repeat protein